MEHKYKRLFNIFIEIIYIAFLICIVAKETLIQPGYSNNVASIINEAVSVINFLKNNILIPALIFLELIVVIYKVIHINEKHLSYILKFLFFSMLYFLMKRYAYYERFEDFILLVYFAKELKFKKIIFIFVIINVLNIINIIFGNTTGYLKIVAAGRGMSFGFNHSNCAGIFISLLFIAVSFLINNKKIIYISFVFIELFVFLTIKSRTTFIILFIYVLLIMLENVYDRLKNKKIVNIIKAFFVLLPILLFIFSIIMSYLIINDYVSFDSNFSVRFSEIIQAYKENGIVSYYRDWLSASKHYFFDNGYGQLLFKHGYVSFVIFNILWLLNNIKIVLNKDYKLAITNICVFIYLLMEFIILLNDLPLVLIANVFAKEENNNSWKYIDDKINKLINKEKKI